FQPVVLGKTLYFLGTADTTNTAQTRPDVTPSAVASETPIPTSTPTQTLNTTVVPRTDSSIYASQVDNSVSGTLLTLPLDADATTKPAHVNTVLESVSSLQAGSSFLIMQDNGHFKMWDTVANEVIS